MISFILNVIRREQISFSMAVLEDLFSDRLTIVNLPLNRNFDPLPRYIELLLSNPLEWDNFSFYLYFLIIDIYFLPFIFLPISTHNIRYKDNISLITEDFFLLFCFRKKKAAVKSNSSSTSNNFSSNNSISFVIFITVGILIEKQEQRKQQKEPHGELTICWFLLLIQSFTFLLGFVLWLVLICWTSRNVRKKKAASWQVL